MAKRTVVLVSCDMAHDEEIGAEIVTITYERQTIEVDLCAACLTERITPLAKAGRVARKPGRKPRATA